MCYFLMFVNVNKKLKHKVIYSVICDDKVNINCKKLNMLYSLVDISLINQQKLQITPLIY